VAVSVAEVSMGTAIGVDDWGGWEWVKCWTGVVEKTRSCGCCRRGPGFVIRRERKRARAARGIICKAEAGAQCWRGSEEGSLSC